MTLPKTFDLDYLLEVDNEEALYNEVSHQFNEMTRDFYAKANFELLRQLEPKPDSRVLDLACGTGYVSLEIAKKVPRGRVLGVDLSSQMISKASDHARRLGLKNADFLQKNIRDLLPGVKSGEFDVGVSCFALSYLGTDYVLENFQRILGPHGQIGLTSGSANSMAEWMPLFSNLLTEHGEQAIASEIHRIPDIPLGPDDLRERMEAAGFRNAKVMTQTIPLTFRNSQEAASYLISVGFISSYFFRMKDKKMRREIVEWALKWLDEFHKDDPHIKTNLEFLIGWNQRRND